MGGCQNEHAARFQTIGGIVELKDTEALSGVTYGECINGEQPSGFVSACQVQIDYGNLVLVIGGIPVMGQLEQLLDAVPFHRFSYLTTKVVQKSAHSFRFDNFFSFSVKWALIITAIFAEQTWDVGMTFRLVKRQCWNEKVSVSVSLSSFLFNTHGCMDPG